MLTYQHSEATQDLTSRQALCCSQWYPRLLGCQHDGLGSRVNHPSTSSKETSETTDSEVTSSQAVEAWSRNPSRDPGDAMDGNERRPDGTTQPPDMPEGMLRHERGVASRGSKRGHRGSRERMRRRQVTTATRNVDQGGSTNCMASLSERSHRHTY